MVMNMVTISIMLMMMMITMKKVVTMAVLRMMRVETLALNSSCRPSARNIWAPDTWLCGPLCPYTSDPPAKINKKDKFRYISKSCLLISSTSG